MLLIEDWGQSRQKM